MTKQKIEVMQAYLDGKTIQILSNGYWGDWGLYYEPVWNWGTTEYRIKPIPIEVWVNVGDNGKAVGTSTFLNEYSASKNTFEGSKPKKFIEDVQ